METKLRTLTKNELKEAAKIFVEAFNSVGQMWNYETALIRLESTFEPEFHFGAFINEKMVGMVATKVEHEVDQKTLCVDIIAVSPSHQGKHIGKMLLDKIEELAKEKKLNNIWLLTSTKLPSFEFYKKNNFSEASWKVVYKNL